MITPAEQPTASRRRIVAGRLAVAAAAVLALTAITVGLLGDISEVLELGGPWLLITLALVAAGSLLVLARPELNYSWVLMVPALVNLGSLTVLITANNVSSPDLTAWLSAVGDMLNTASIPLVVGLGLLLFPNGQPPSRRWRWLIVVIVLAAAAGSLAALFLGGWGGDADQALAPSPLSNELGGVGEKLSKVFAPLLGLTWILSATSLLFRYRGSEGTERKQTQWLAVAAFYGILLTLTTGFLVGEWDIVSDTVTDVLLSLGFTLIPAGITVAVLRYRLYDVDVVISRSLIVAGLALFILVVYVGVVVGVGTIVTDSDEPNIALQIGATALVAVGFQPWRRRLRRWVDRVVYGHRASPYDVLASFSRIAARTPDERTRDEIADLLARGTGADPAVLWLRVGDRIRPVASRPSRVELDPVPVSGDQLPGLAGDLVVPVRHDDELLGALSVSKPRGEQLSPQDVDVTEQLAASVALTLRAERLTAELAERLDEIKTSRARIVQAQGDARRRLERDLHDGAQQQLVALKVKLGLARSNAERAQATRTAGLLEQIGADADDAVESLRDLARGIHPPMLEAEGLPAAIRTQARKAALAVEVIDQGVGRAHSDTELAVYYCVLEALQNTAKYAHATSAVVTLGRDGDEIVFAVHDDGQGFDPASADEGTGLQGMRDRIDTVEGTLEIDAAPGRGTTVRGHAPTAGSAASTSHGELAALGVGTGTDP